MKILSKLVMTISNTFDMNSLWNELGGKPAPEFGTTTYWQALKDQAERIREELDELDLAIKERDSEEVLDAGCDLAVTVDGLNMLHGHDYQSAISAVIENNFDKYTNDPDVAFDRAIELTEDTGWNHHSHVETWGDHVVHSVHRAHDDKICKLQNHPKVDLKPFLKV